MEAEINNEQLQKQEETMMKQDDIVPIELPAPSGWKKKYTPKKGGTPRRNAIVFVSPTGEEIKSKRQLDQYLKAHHGGPSASEFDWGTGGTPRRSSRLNEKVKVTESPETETPKKKARKSSSKNQGKDKSDMEDEGDVAEGKQVTTGESQGSREVEMADGENAGGCDDEEISSKEVQADNVNDAEKKSEDGETVTVMPVENEDNMDEKTGESNDEPIVKKDDAQKAENKPSDDVKEENADGKSLAAPAVEESDEVASDPSKLEVACDLPLESEVAEAETVKDAANPKAEDEHVGDSGDAVVGPADDAEAAPVDADNLDNIKKTNDGLDDHAVAGDQGASS